MITLYRLIHLLNTIYAYIMMNNNFTLGALQVREYVYNREGYTARLRMQILIMMMALLATVKMCSCDYFLKKVEMFSLKIDCGVAFFLY